MNDKSVLLKAAVAGIVGVAVVSAPGLAKEKKAHKQMAEVVKCYGVNSCSGKGKCGGPGHACAGKNSCKGQGWLLMPKESCESIEGGSLTPPATPQPDESQKK